MKPWCFYRKFLQISQTSPRKFFQNRFWKALRLRCKILKLCVTIFGRYALKVNIFSVEIFQSKLLWLDEDFVVLLNQKQFSIAFLLSATVTGCSIVETNHIHEWYVAEVKVVSSDLFSLSTISTTKKLLLLYLCSNIFFSKKSSLRLWITPKSCILHLTVRLYIIVVLVLTPVLEV